MSVAGLNAFASFVAASPPDILLLVGDVDAPTVGMCRAWAQGLADRLRVSIDYARGEPEIARRAFFAETHRLSFSTIEPATWEPVPTGFPYLTDGRPDWRVMAERPLDLALLGGRPHRSPDSRLRHTDDTRALAEGYDAAAEIRRGIFETTALYSEPSEKVGWLSVTCDSPTMATWMAACIVLENVDARYEDERLLVPASPPHSR